jgi:tRNA threonylcarbamoyladenosine modification (KEOPS) complex  Pcc1 subunit
LEPQPPTTEARILIEASRENVEIIIGALKPEMESGLSDRSKIVLEMSPKGLVIKVTADDVTALRAAVNSYLYWVQGIMDIGGRVSH